MDMQTASTRLKAARLGIWLTGAFFLFAALVKVFDFAALRAQIQRYDLLPGEMAGTAAAVVILLEALLGLACLKLFQARKALWSLLGLLIAFSSATWIRFGQLQGTDCQCLGALFPGGPETVLLRNAVLAACIAALLVLTRKSPLLQASGWRRLGLGVAAVLLTIVATRSFSGTSGLEAAPSQDDQLRIFLSATCKTCKKSVGRVGELASRYRAAPLRIFIAAHRQKEIDEFLQGIELQGGYVPLTVSQLARQVERVPTVQLLHQGKVLKEWVGEVPALAELESSALPPAEPTESGTEK